MKDIRPAIRRFSSRAAIFMKSLAIDFTKPPSPVTLPGDLRDFLILLGNGKDAKLIEENHPEILRRAMEWRLVKYDYGSYQDDGWYVVTRLGKVSLFCEDRLKPFRTS